MSIKQFDMKEVIKQLETASELMTKIYGLFDDPLDDEEQPDKPYIFVSIASDTPDPIETKTRVEFRIISHNENVSKNTIREIDNILVDLVGNRLLYGTFMARNVVVEDGFEIQEAKNRNGFIRDFLFYFIN